MTLPLCICGMGMVTALGQTAEETFTAYEAGVRGFRRTSVLGLDGQPLIASLAMPVSPELIGLTRAIALARPALTECLGQVTDAAGRRTALLLCTPPLDAVQLGPQLARAAPFDDLRTAWSQLLALVASELETNHRVPVRALLTFETGHAAGVVALRRAAQLLESGAVEQCILGGVDSAGERTLLERLDLLDQIPSNRVPHGVVPGEAAAFLCLRRAASRCPAVIVAGASYAHEHASWPATGDGLMTAVTNALAAWGGDPRVVAFMAADLHGRREHAASAAYAALRTVWPTQALPTLIHPADQLGNVGAASAPLLLGIAARRLLVAPRGSAALVVCSSSATLRGAAVVARPTWMVPSWHHA